LKAIFYTKNYKNKITKKANIILSPEFYWIKEIKANVNLIEAKKIAKNMFDLDDSYIIDVLKINNKFYAYALKKINIPKKYINNLYLAQSLDIKDCVEIDGICLKNVNGIIFQIPCNNCKKEDINNLKIISKPIKINRVEIPILVIAGFLLINIAFLSAGIYYKLKKPSMQDLKKYNLPLTNIQLDALINELKYKIQKSNKLKEDLRYILKAPIELKYENKTITIISKKNLENYLKKRFKLKTNSFKDGIYKAEIEYE
jgi:hypothetical protein